MAFRVVGVSAPRKEAHDKVTGAAVYVDDLYPLGVLHGATIRSSIPRGRILQVDFRHGVPWDEFVIVTAKDIPGANVIALIADDQPCLAGDFVNHPSEPVLLLAHENKDLLRKARNLVHIEYEPFPAVFDIDTALKRETVIWGEDNVFKRYTMIKGDVDAVWADALRIASSSAPCGGFANWH